MKKTIQIINKSNKRKFNLNKTNFDKKEQEAEKEYQIKNIEYNEFTTFKSLDEFDINIIDLNDRDIWLNHDDSYSNINMEKDLNHIKNMIRNSNKFDMVIILPQDISLKYHYKEAYGHAKAKYRKQKRLKDIPKSQRKILQNFLPEYNYLLFFENTKTSLNEQNFQADFYFDTNDSSEIKTFSDYGEKATTVTHMLDENKNILITTLNLDTEDKLLDYLSYINLLNKIKSVVPKWINEIEILDDSLLKNETNKIREKICKLEEEKDIVIQKITKNNEYKEILYEKDERLENRVREILGEILEVDLSNFEDNKKEDFLIKLDDIIFIGEIKGVNSNIKNSHISQLVNHVDLYVENLEAQKESRVEIKPILIINYQRNRSIEYRNEINEDQIIKAKRDNVLIIKTDILLKLLEKVKEENMQVENIIKILRNSNGILKEEHLNKL